jgi:hypothetical protein
MFFTSGKSPFLNSRAKMRRLFKDFMSLSFQTSYSAKVQTLLNGKVSQRKLYEKQNDETPLRALITCSKCGGKLTSSASKGRSRYYNYYHCRNGCTERIPADVAHEALLDYFDDVAVKPKIEKLYLEVMKTIFQANESSREQDINKLKENISSAEKKLASLEEKYVLNEIERTTEPFPEALILKIFALLRFLNTSPFLALQACSQTLRNKLARKECTS